MDEGERQQWNVFTARCLFSVVSHPLEYARTLMQLGFEPLPPNQSSTLFGRQVLILPSAFKYVGYIKSVDGYFGCYRGLVPKLLGSCASSFLSTKVFKKIKSSWFAQDELRIDSDEEIPSFQKYANMVKGDVIFHTLSIIVSYPFQVVSVRMMAYFIGREESYSSMFSTIISIYQDSGIFGFFHGLVPKLIADVSAIVISTIASYFINKYLVSDKELRTYTLPFLAYVSNAVTYPFLVVSTCMSVSGSRLSAGQPPLMPVYSSWLRCWSHLSSTGQQKRGYAIIYRYYTGPTAYVNNRPMALPLNKTS